MNVHNMIDFESLSRRRDAAVFALGVVKFNEEGEIEGKTFMIPTGEQVNSHVCPQTIRWWMEMPELYKVLTFPQDDEPPLLRVIASIVDYLGEDPIWCNWAKSDGNWLDQLCTYLDHTVNFRQYRCYATMMKGWPQAYQVESRHLTSHHPLDDSRKQVLRLVHLNSSLGEGNGFL